ncbi:MAG TPA: hypothetical protein VEV43_15740 [Actinomycetota bacterium]|nr:hypothetical protein [Actinomycetota bacterium]
MPSIAQPIGSVVTEDVSADATSIAVEDAGVFSTHGGEAVFERGTANEEALTYSGVDLDAHRLIGLTRSNPLTHPSGTFLESVTAAATPTPAPAPSPTTEVPEGTPPPSSGDADETTNGSAGEETEPQDPCEIAAGQSCSDVLGGVISDPPELTCNGDDDDPPVCLDGWIEDPPELTCNGDDDDPPVCLNENLPECNADASCEPILPRTCAPGIQPCHPLPLLPVSGVAVPEAPVVAVAGPDLEEPPVDATDAVDVGAGTCTLPSPHAAFEGFKDSEGVVFGDFFYGVTATCEIRMASMSVAVWIHNHANGEESDSDAGGCSGGGDSACKMAVASGSHHCDPCNGGWQAHATAVFELRRGKKWDAVPARCSQISKRIITCRSKSEVQKVPA